MWRLILKVPSGRQLMGSMAIKHGVSLTGYPLSYWRDKKCIYLLTAGIIFGEEKNKKAFIKEAKSNPGIKEFEAANDFVISVSEQPLFSEPVYNPKILRPNPVIINKKGFHIWDLASFDRKVLEEVLRFAEKYLEAKIVKFVEEKISNISFTKILPELTDKQKKAMELALHEGYYDFPKKVNMEDLADKMGISYSTFQAHLKKAESKLLPLIYKEL